MSRGVNETVAGVTKTEGQRPSLGKCYISCPPSATLIHAFLSPFFGRTMNILREQARKLNICVKRGKKAMSDCSTSGQHYKCPFPVHSEGANTLHYLEDSSRKLWKQKGPVRVE